MIFDHFEIDKSLQAVCCIYTTFFEISNCAALMVQLAVPPLFIAMKSIKPLLNMNPTAVATLKLIPTITAQFLEMLVAWT